MTTTKTQTTKTPTPQSRDAKRLAAVLLDVLAGARTPTQAAEALGVSLPRYYQLEARGLGGLIEACEPRPRGRQANVAAEVETLRRDNERLRRDLSRQQSLVRLTQRTIGVAPPPPVKETGKRRQRKPTVRALRRAGELRAEAGPEESGAASPE